MGQYYARDRTDRNDRDRGILTPSEGKYCSYRRHGDCRPVGDYEGDERIEDSEWGANDRGK